MCGELHLDLVVAGPEAQARARQRVLHAAAVPARQPLWTVRIGRAARTVEKQHKAVKLRLLHIQGTTQRRTRHESSKSPAYPRPVKSRLPRTLQGSEFAGKR